MTNNKIKEIKKEEEEENKKKKWQRSPGAPVMEADLTKVALYQFASCNTPGYKKKRTNFVLDLRNIFRY